MRAGEILSRLCLGVLFACACAYCLYWIGEVL